MKSENIKIYGLFEQIANHLPEEVLHTVPN